MQTAQEYISPAIPPVSQHAPIRVCMVLTRLGAGGPPFVVLELLKGLREQGVDAILITGSRDEEHDCSMDYLAQYDVPVVCIPEMSRAVHWFHDLNALIAMYKTFRRLRPQVVHTHTSKAGVVGRLAALAARVPVVVHTYHGNVLKGYFGRLVSRAVRVLEASLALGSDALFVLSRQQAREIADEHRIAPHRKVHIVPIGVHAEKFAAIPAPAVDSERLTVGWFGRFVPIKDVPLMIEVAVKAITHSDRIDFVIGGDGPERELVEAAAQRHGVNRIRYKQWIPDLRQVLPEVDVVLQTSRNEGTPVALLEGMASGRPFVSTAVGGVVDMVSGVAQNRTRNSAWHDNAVLTGRDPNDIVSVLMELMNNRSLLARMGHRARRLTEDCFVPKTYCSGTLAVYQRHIDAIRGGQR